MGTLALLKAILTILSSLGVLAFLYKIYRVGYDKGKLDTERKTLTEIAKRNRQLLVDLLAMVDNPNSPFQLRGENSNDSD